MNMNINIVKRLRWVGKALYMAITLLIFLNIFIANELPWKVKFSAFGVPANSWSGGDSRNIQMAVYCDSVNSNEDRSACINSGAPVKNLYSEASIPALNYPSLLVDLYATFSNYSEDFFLRFWRLNALLLVSAIFALSWVYNFKSFPFLVFNPVVLLTVERGNTDALIFSLIFIPLLLFRRSDFLRVLFLGLASALKIFPIIAYLALAMFRNSKSLIGVVFGIIFSAPLVIYSIFQLPQIMANTPKGFGYAYGFSSMLYIPEAKLPLFIANFYPLVAYTGLIIFSLFFLWALRWLSQAWKGKNNLDQSINQLSQTDLMLVVVSLSIFLSTFWLSVSFAYRLIFLIPFFLVMGKSQFLPLNFIRALVFCILWVPVIPLGWVFLNLLCYPLALILSFYAIRLVMLRYDHVALNVGHIK
jgi:Glycosyltransferase family 87